MKRFWSCSLTASAVILFAAVVVWGWLYGQMYRANGNIISGGEKRAYLLYIPDSLDLSRPAPLVISLHGFAGWPYQIVQISRWNKLADEFGFIVVYPRGHGMPMRWRAFGRIDGADNSDADLNFISDLIDQLELLYNIDPQRIYVNGKSLGGGMSFALACKLSDRIAAFGAVSSGFTMPWDECNPSRPVPAILFQGDGDPYVPYHGGLSVRANTIFPDIPQWVETLAQRNGCNRRPEAIPTRGDVTGIQYTNCDQNASVALYTILGGGHTWPGDRSTHNPLAGRVSEDIDATRTMWEFFQAHPKP